MLLSAPETAIAALRGGARHYAQALIESAGSASEATGFQQYLSDVENILRSRDSADATPDAIA